MASAPTTTPVANVTLADPTPPCNPPAIAPVPAPTLPWAGDRLVAELAARWPKEASGR